MNAHQRRVDKRRFYRRGYVVIEGIVPECYGPNQSFWDKLVTPYPVLYRNPMAEGPGGYAGFVIDEARPVWAPPGAPIAPTNGLVVGEGTRPEFPWGPFPPVEEESEDVVKERLAKFRNVY